MSKPELLTPCKHHSAEEYTRIVEECANAVHQLLRQRLETTDGGICPTAFIEILEQMHIYHMKLFINQYGLQAGDEYIKRVCHRLLAHGEHVLMRGLPHAGN